MQIVIDIPEEAYEDIKFHINCNWKSIIALHEAMKNGTILPKGHGRLIDEDKLANAYDTAKNLDIYGCGGLIINSPTIVEADKEGEYGD